MKSDKPIIGLGRFIKRKERKKQINMSINVGDMLLNVKLVLAVLTSLTYAWIMFFFCLSSVT